MGLIASNFKFSNTKSNYQIIIPKLNFSVPSSILLPIKMYIQTSGSFSVLFFAFFSFFLLVWIFINILDKKDLKILSKEDSTIRDIWSLKFKLDLQEKRTSPLAKFLIQQKDKPMSKL